MRIHKSTGLPIVMAEEILTFTNINRWPVTEPSMPAEEYRDHVKTMSQSQRAWREPELRFMPQTEAVFLERPDGKPYTQFRTIGGVWICVFVMLPRDLVLLTVEYKGGVDEIVINASVAGVPNRKERELLPPPSEWESHKNLLLLHETFARTTERECLEETGIQVNAELIGNPQGVAVSGRKSTERYFMFLGRNPKKVAEPQHDETEFIERYLTPLREWLRMMEQGIVFEASAHHITYEALKKLGRLAIQ